MTASELARNGLEYRARCVPVIRNFRDDADRRGSGR
jgi:hypothetical protein